MDTLEKTTPPEYALEIVDEERGEATEYGHITKYANKEFRERRKGSFANKIGNLAQGTGGCIKFSGTIYPIKHKDIPANRKTTYGIPQKEDLYYTHLTVGGNLINYPGDV